MGKDSLIKSTGNPSGNGKKKPAAGKTGSPKGASEVKNSGGTKAATAKAAAGPHPESAAAPGPAPAPEPPAAAALEPRPQTGSGDGANGSQTDPVVRAAIIGAAILALLAVLIIWASFANRAKYYIVPEGDGVAVWQGIFSPTGKRLLAVLPALQPAEPIKEVYARNEVYPLIYTHYLAGADALLQADGLPDYPTIEGHLKAAQRYAADPTARAAVRSRIDNLQRTRLIHQAHVEISKDTPESLAVALERLEQAQRVARDAVQLEAINQIVTLVNERRAELQSEGDTAPAGE